MVLHRPQHHRPLLRRHPHRPTLLPHLRRRLPPRIPGVGYQTKTPPPRIPGIFSLAQVGPILGAGGFFGGGPAPQNGLLCTTLAQVPTLFPHLRQYTPTPAPKSSAPAPRSGEGEQELLDDVGVNGGSENVNQLLFGESKVSDFLNDSVFYIEIKAFCVLLK